MTNNKEKFLEIADFSDPDKFYFLQVLMRKKDTDNKLAKNNGARCIKPYFIRSEEYLEYVWPEITKLCDVFEARACITVNPRSFRKNALKTISEIVVRLEEQHENTVWTVYNSVAGKYSAAEKGNKCWIIDIDDPSVSAEEIISTIKDIRPEGDKYVGTIPSKSGTHLIVRPFDISLWKKPEKVELLKDGLTNIYIP